MLSKRWVWDPGSEIRDPEKTYSGSRIQGSKRHRVPDPGSGSATLMNTVLTRTLQDPGPYGLFLGLPDPGP
jgi:hypothetical protein